MIRYLGGKRRSAVGGRPWLVLGGMLGAWNGIASAQGNPVLVFPRESDRMMVLIMAAILIGGLALIVDQLRRRAGRRRQE